MCEWVIHRSKWFCKSWINGSLRFTMIFLTLTIGHPKWLYCRSNGESNCSSSVLNRVRGMGFVSSLSLMVTEETVLEMSRAFSLWPVNARYCHLYRQSLCHHTLCQGLHSLPVVLLHHSQETALFVPISTDILRSLLFLDTKFIFIFRWAKGTQQNIAPISFVKNLYAGRSTFIWFPSDKHNANLQNLTLGYPKLA